jgi:cbb3-type cytochrome oxidase subunit 3
VPKGTAFLFLGGGGYQVNGEIMAWVTTGLTVVLLAVVWWRTRPANAGEAAAQIQEMSEFARDAVMAAEQLWQTGKMPKSGRLDYVLGLVQAQFGVDRETALMSAEAAVFWLKHVAQRTGQV